LSLLSLLLLLQLFIYGWHRGTTSTSEECGLSFLCHPLKIQQGYRGSTSTGDFFYFF